VLLRRLSRLVLYPIIGLALILMLRHDAHLLFGGAAWVNDLVFGLGMLAGSVCIFEGIFPAPSPRPTPTQQAVPQAVPRPAPRPAPGHRRGLLVPRLAGRAAPVPGTSGPDRRPRD
jgi:hypothetical protein